MFQLLSAHGLHACPACASAQSEAGGSQTWMLLFLIVPLVVAVVTTLVIARVSRGRSSTGDTAVAPR